ncbi:hypothetical protein [Cohnella sp. OV330]|uniref:hypothetical protein n=1 Tax=Cohnella sp. OV330 TaxID=1855288 RepID=UPI000B7E6264|nr:hypothetical protein [Cohnella sp. OV330]
MNYSYEEFLQDLSIGREIHFIYKETDYYIGCGTGRYMFYKAYDDSSEVMGDNVDDLLRKVELHGNSIKEVWNDIKIDIIF